MNRRDFATAFTALTGFLARASNQIATVAVTLVATRYLDPTTFGVFALGAIAVTLVRTLLYSGAFEYLLKAPDPRACSSESLAVNLLLGAGLSGLLALGAVISQRWLGAGAVAAVLLALLPSNLISAVAAWRESLLLRSGRVRLYYALTTLAELIAMAAAIMLLVAGNGVSALVWQVYVRGAAILILYVAAGRAVLSAGFSRPRFIVVLRWSVSRYAAVMIGFGSNYAADLFLGVFLSPAATGLYRASSRMVTAVADLFIQPARLIAMTLFSRRSAAGEGSDMIWPPSFVATAAVGWSALAGLAAVAPLIVPVALGEQWRAAAALVPILCVARALALFDGVAAAALVAYDHQRALLRAQTLGAATSLLLIAAAAPFGIVPATIAVACGALCGSVLIARCAFRRSPQAAPALARALPALIAPVAATIAGAVAGRVGANGAHAVTLLSVAIASGMAAWLAAMLLLRRHAMGWLTAFRHEPASSSAMGAAV